VKKREKWLKSAQKLQKKCEISGLGHFFAFEIGPRFEDSEKLSLIGFDWVCFPIAGRRGLFS